MSVINQVLQELDKRQTLERQEGAEKNTGLNAPQSVNGGADMSPEAEPAQDSRQNAGFVRPQVAFQSQLKETSVESDKSTLRLVVITALLLLLAAGVWMLKQPEPVVSNVSQITVQAAKSSNDRLAAESLAAEALANETIATAASSADTLASETQLKPAPIISTKVTGLEAELVEPVAIEAIAVETVDVDSLDSTESAQGTLLQVEVSQAEPVADKVLTPQAARTQGVSLAENVTEADVTNTPSSMAVTEVILTPVQRVNKLLLQAQSNEEQGGLQAAIQAYKQVLILTPKQDEARKKLTALHYGQGEYAQALALMDSGIIQAATQWEWYLIKAKIQQAQGNIQAALATLHSVPDKSLWAKEKWAAQGDIGQKSGDYALAVAAYFALSTQEPSKGLWWMGLAYAQDSQQDYQEASKSYRRALGASGLSNSARAYITDRLVQLGESR